MVDFRCKAVWCGCGVELQQLEAEAEGDLMLQRLVRGRAGGGGGLQSNAGLHILLRWCEMRVKLRSCGVSVDVAAASIPHVEQCSCAKPSTIYLGPRLQYL